MAQGDTFSLWCNNGILIAKTVRIDAVSSPSGGNGKFWPLLLHNYNPCLKARIITELDIPFSHYERIGMVDYITYHSQTVSLTSYKYAGTTEQVVSRYWRIKVASPAGFNVISSSNVLCNYIDTNGELLSLPDELSFSWNIYGRVSPSYQVPVHIILYEGVADPTSSTYAVGGRIQNDLPNDECDFSTIGQ